MKLAIIADDLTGALDSAVHFAERGLKVLRIFDAGMVSKAVASDADVLAVSTGSRELHEDEAAKRVRDVLDEIRKHSHETQCLIFKKVDSRLKGHIAREIEVMGYEDDQILVCPAIPKLGRFVRDGFLQGVGVEDPIDVAATIPVSRGCCFDASSQADIDAALKHFPNNGLLVGAAGLAEGMAKKMVPTQVKRPGLTMPAPCLFAIGSRDPVTLAQLEAFYPIKAPNGDVPDPFPFPEKVKVIQMTQGSEVVSGKVAGSAFSCGVARWIKELELPSFLACGGESAAEICANLDIDLLQILGEIMPGLPLSRATTGGRDLLIATKSGGFGNPDTLEYLAQNLVIECDNANRRDPSK
ncbi:four-carbon acid sugar kinase family protein [uncultured Cohaesibacter sp.]|uniref:four-carbon acid sugar kinase family protein n=1 Tax=uncultured Cohaesibacter sp. TaxID=1002546 RepID=UPI0029315B85|nr:four-carbon acid sugar kinase family protein [uncultured Cohaesibacter sp.]